MKSYRMCATVVAMFDVEAEDDAAALALAAQTLGRWDDGEPEPGRGLDLRLYRPVETCPVGVEPEIEEVIDQEEA